MRSTLTSLLVTTTLTVGAAAAQEDLTDMYRETGAQLIGAAMTDVEGWEKLTHLTTHIGHRLSGSPQLEEAIEWIVETARSEGFEHVEAQPVSVPHWVRGEERLDVTSPRPRRLAMLGLGGSIATPTEGIEAPVVVVGSFDQLAELGRESIEGRIVVYAVPWTGYGGTVRYRSRGATEAARYGAVAALVRSATGSSLYTPHTGAMRYEEGVTKIPAAAITVEDADWFRQMATDGIEVRARLQMEARTLEPAASANVIVEIAGREHPEQVVVMGGHLDSWDVGQGAHDDGAACMAAWQALRVIARLGLQPRRTLRVVLWTNEENGLAGGRAYRESLGDRVSDHVFAIEMDSGNERPVGFGLGLSGVDPSSGDARYETLFAQLEQIGRLLEGIDAGTIFRGGGGADIGPLMQAGVPGLGLRTVGEHYFDWHHTDADTLDKIDPQDFRKAIAALAVFGYVLADMPGPIEAD